MSDRSASSMEDVFKQIHSFLPKEALKTATVDRGKEFSCYHQVERVLKIKIYFADPYSAWQKGTNENSNGLLREFFPKKTDLAIVSERDLFQALWLINHRPRKCLNWKSAHEVFMDGLSHLN